MSQIYGGQKSIKTFYFDSTTEEPSAPNEEVNIYVHKILS